MLRGLASPHPLSFQQVLNPFARNCRLSFSYEVLDTYRRSPHVGFLYKHVRIGTTTPFRIPSLISPSSFLLYLSWKQYSGPGSDTTYLDDNSIAMTTCIPATKTLNYISCKQLNYNNRLPSMDEGHLRVLSSKAHHLCIKQYLLWEILYPCVTETRRWVGREKK